MWRVYLEVAGERLGVMMPDRVEAWLHTGEAEARSAFRRTVDGLLREGFRLNPEVVPYDAPLEDSIEDWIGLEHDDGRMVLVVLFRPTTD